MWTSVCLFVLVVQAKMGNIGSRFHSSKGPEETGESSRKHGCEWKRKRNTQCDCEDDKEDDDAILDTPRRQVTRIKFSESASYPHIPSCIAFLLSWILNRKKLKSTSNYIYQTLFLNGENSDIRICTLGQEWNLHKLYLCQVKQTTRLIFIYLLKDGFTQ